MVFCFFCCIASTVISFKFRNINLPEEKVKPTTFKEYKEQLKESFRFFLNSKRMKSLILFNAVLMGIILGIVNLRSSMLSEMMVPEQYFGIVFAVLQFIAAISSRMTNTVQSTFKNKTLAFLSLPLTISCIVIGFIGGDPLSKSSFILIFLLYLIQYAIKGPYQALMGRYLNNFTNRKIRPKIVALKNLMANLFTAIVTLLSSLLLQITTTANTFIIIGCISTILVVLMLDYMKKRVGLKPSQYPKEDMKYSLVKTTKQL